MKKALGQIGFEPVAAGARCFWHEELRLLVTIYVDDIRCSGPELHLVKGWDLIRTKISIGEVSNASLCLGCIHKKSFMKFRNWETFR